METQNDWCEFYTCDSIKPGPFVNYEKQIKALSGMALTAARGGFKRSLLFGFPGTGKSNAPFALVKHLKENLSLCFSLTMIRCDELATKLYSEQYVNEKIISLNKSVERAKRNAPALICFDEMESIWSQVEISPAKAILLSWARDFLDAYTKKVMILGITNYPAIVEPSLLRRFPSPIYFDLPTPKMIEKIVQKQLKIERYVDVAYLLVRGYSEVGLSPVGKEIVLACKELQIDEPKLSTFSEKEIAYRLLAYSSSGGATSDSVTKYKEQQRSLIMLSNRYTIPVWLQFYQKQIRENRK